MKIPFLIWFLLLPLLTLLFGIDVALVSGGCQGDQRSLLLQLKKSLAFDQSKSTRLGNWTSSADSDCCDWPGVTCDGDGLGRVIGLNLSNESIFDGLEDANPLFNLQFLQNLDLSYNNFNTSISPCFADLTSLISLNLSNAGFVGQIPVAISRMKKLVSLDLSVPSIYFYVQATLELENPNLATLVQNLTQLRELHLDGVNISAKGNEWCRTLSSSLPNLNLLSLSNCFLSGPIDHSLAKLQSLTVIRLNGNNLSAPVPEFFANFTNLTVLNLASCMLNGSFPENIFQVPTLEILDLSNNQELQGQLPSSFQISSLKTLVLSNTNFSGRLPESIGTIRNLSRIELSACNFIGSLPVSMADLTELVYMDFSANMFTGPIPAFGKSKKLMYVDLSHNNLYGMISNSHWQGLSNLVYLNLRNNSLGGSIPSSLFAIPSLQKLQLSSNQFSGLVPNFSYPSFLATLDLSRNNLTGAIPRSLFDLTRLNVLSLSSNKFSGTIKLDWIHNLHNLTALDLSYSNLTVDASISNSTLSSFPQMTKINLASCYLSSFPDLRNQSNLIFLDLSDNQINGTAPQWLGGLSNSSLLYLNLSHNLLVSLPERSLPTSLVILDLHSNQLRGNIPTPPPSATYVDYSNNKFTSSIPPNIGNSLLFTIFFSLSNNGLVGVIPESICNASYPQVLDVSNNSLIGTIPDCLIERSETLDVLNLKGNRFHGYIPDKFPLKCALKTLDLNGNLLEGKVPRSLANCPMLEVVNLGNNKLNDTFPCLLKNISTMRVLVLRNNNFSGRIRCPNNQGPWPMLQIIDLASNCFGGNLPERFFNTWQTMMGDGNEILGHLSYETMPLSGLYYQDSITVTIKGLQMTLVKILTIYTTIDLSCNKIEGPIPQVTGLFNALYALNLSHNALTGQIPSSFGNLSHVESLDLSVNNLSGIIPLQLANLTFLSFINLSFNQLEGRIPTSTQLQSFLPESFIGNKGLCGPPLMDIDVEVPMLKEPNSKDTNSHSSNFHIDMNFIVSVELGFIFGIGIIILPLLYWKRWRMWYYKQVDDHVIFKIFPHLNQKNRNCRRRAHGNWRPKK